MSLNEASQTQHLKSGTQPMNDLSQANKGTPRSVDADVADRTDAEISHAPVSADSVAVADQDVLVGLVERTGEDAAAPFAPEVVAGLAALKRKDLAAFEVLRTRLKNAGCRVTALDQAIDCEIGEAGDGAVNEADILVQLAKSVELFRCPDGSSYADLEVNGHRETWPVKSKTFKRWLERHYYQLERRAPSAFALQSAIGLIEARAQYDAPEREIYVRVATVGSHLYLDLCDEAWRAVEVDPTGWRVIERPPVRFRRAAGMQPLPEPTCGGTLDMLRAFLNVRSGADFVLVVAWVLTALRTHSGYPLLVLSGEQGSAKSTFSQLLRSLVDPNTAPLRALPQQERDLFIAATNGHLLAFDNVSALPEWLSDTFCRLATGTGFAARQLYSDLDEILFKAAKPILLNGIEEIVTRPDLADRAVFLVLEPIAEESRRAESELWAKFETERSQIMGVLLDGLVMGLKKLPETRLAKLPRMADFVLWATACETAYWPTGTFSAAYLANRDNAVEDVLEADPVASAIRGMMQGRETWSGSASELLVVLPRYADAGVPKTKSWPPSARSLGNRARRAATFLRKVGIGITFSREGKTRTRKRTILISHTACLPAEGDRTQSSASSVPSASDAMASVTQENALSIQEQDTQRADNVADGPHPVSYLTARAKALKNGTSAVMDVADANSSYMSVLAKPVLLPWKGRL